MVRNSQPWELGEPNLNDRGQPIVHNIAQKLGLIRFNYNYTAMPLHSQPKDESGSAELPCQLENQQSHDQEASDATSSTAAIKYDESFSNSINHYAMPPVFMHSDIVQEYSKTAVGNYNAPSLVRQSSTSCTVFEPNTATHGFSACDLLLAQYSMSELPSWALGAKFQDQPHQPLQLPESRSTVPMPYIQQLGSFNNLSMMRGHSLDGELGRGQLDILSCVNSGLMIGAGETVLGDEVDKDFRMR
ncbi:hypothetical protein NQ176_g232 [Zarea fungicola]|uniref:Uncharacterized protein n=1 Tax=Zarea fungicola TaxID=93591 RepID=A0ACC1NXL1_9HYPO|nr:hypothetical protein NQ176_g232 [Lecanicillium fungicola]